MDEDELDTLLDQIDALDTRLGRNRFIQDDDAIECQLRDEHGHRVPGCYMVGPAATD